MSFWSWPCWEKDLLKACRDKARDSATAAEKIRSIYNDILLLKGVEQYNAIPSAIDEIWIIHFNNSSPYCDVAINRYQLLMALLEDHEKIKHLYAMRFC